MSSQPSAPVSVLGLKATVMYKVLLLPSNNSKYFLSLTHQLHPLRIWHDLLSSLSPCVYSKSKSVFLSPGPK